MNIFRSILLWSSKNQFLKNNLPGFYFVNKAVKKFMPGEKAENAIEAAKMLSHKKLGTVLTYLGENLNHISDAEAVKDLYIDLLEKIYTEKLDAEISVKLTQLGLDISYDKAVYFLEEIAAKAKDINNFVWIDMEGSSYTEVTIKFYNQVHNKFKNTGLCLQAYLYRTKNDIESVLDNSSSIRLVKGAYKESAGMAFQNKSEVDKNYLAIAEILLKAKQHSERKIVFGTHDFKIINKIKETSGKASEFHLLYGIKMADQIKLAEEGYKVKTLISYGEAWFPWYMRRLAERPANIWFVLKNIFSN
jgi:proline dehydrogenase